MRITNSMMTNSFLRNMYNNMERVDKYQTQLITSRKLTRLSDDPVGAIKSMDARVKLYRIAQYEQNVDIAKSWMTQAETALMELSSILTTAYEKTVQGASDIHNATDRKALSELVLQLRDHVADIGNTKMGELFIFGGYNTNTNPFVQKSITADVPVLDADGNPVDDPANPGNPLMEQKTFNVMHYNGIPMYNPTELGGGSPTFSRDASGAWVYDPSSTEAIDALMGYTDPVSGDYVRGENDQIIQYEIGFSMLTDATIPGTRLMGIGDNNIFKILDDLYNALSRQFDDPTADTSAIHDEITAAITKIQNVHGTTLARTAEVGGKSLRLDLMSERYATDTLNYETVKSNVEDVDEAEAIMQWKMAQAVYTAALQVGAQIMQTKLLDFIR